MTTNNLPAALAVIISLASPALHAQQLYVADKLVLNVHTEANQGGERVGTIETGDVVDEIERVENFVHIRLGDGREGWVGANYLTAQPPAIVRLKELQAGQAPAAPASPPKQLTDDLARLQKQNAALTAEVAELKKKSAAASAAVAATPAVAATATPAAHEVNAPEPDAAPAPVVVINRSYWWAWVLAVIIASGGGFVAGYQTLGRRVRDRFGGVKVY